MMKLWIFSNNKLLHFDRQRKVGDNSKNKSVVKLEGMLENEWVEKSARLWDPERA
jgi:hypothetical protein